jgi:hypothetical protein
MPKSDKDLLQKESNQSESLPEIEWVGELDRDRPDLGLPKLQNLQTRILYTADPSTGTYSHHAYITDQNGTLFAIWSNHLRDEDASGQRVLASRSRDKGKTWEPFFEVFPPRDNVKPTAEQDKQNDRVQIANGFAIVDERVFAISEVHVFANRKGFGRLAREIPARGKPGSIFWLVDDPPEPRAGFPAFPAASDPGFTQLAEKINTYLAQPEQLPSWEFVKHDSRPKAEDGHQLCEPTQAWQLADGTHVRLYRDLGQPRTYKNYAQFSFDQGKTWTQAIRTDFPDACSRSAAGVLPNGTVYVINNPGNGRDPLVISLAKDGLTFDRHAVIAMNAPKVRYPGRAKGPGFQYPRATVLHDALFVIYSVGKEDVWVTRIPLEGLESLE